MLRTLVLAIIALVVYQIIVPRFTPTHDSTCGGCGNCAISLQSMLHTINAQVELYGELEGRLPWAPGEVGDTQWSALVERSYFQAAPRNRLSSEHRGTWTRIVEVAEPGATGAQIDPLDAGWVWNSADNRMYATGFPEASPWGASP